MMKTLWIITELFPPEETSTAYILGEIANAMAQKYTVKVITGPQVYDKRKKTDPCNVFQLHSSVEVFRVKTVDVDKNTIKGKIAGLLSASYKLSQEVKKRVRRQDKVLVVTNPLPLIVLMSHLKNTIGFELNILVHDIFPENAKPSNIHIPCEAIVKKVFDRAYSKADCLIALGRDMKLVLEKKTSGFKNAPQIVIIENWADIVNIRPIERVTDNNIVIEYAGNIGRGQGLSSFITNLKKSNNNQLKFDLYVTGALEDTLKTFVKNNNIKDVEFHGAYFRSQQNVVLNNCDIALVTLAEGLYGLGVPSKTYNIMAAGKPILFIGHTDSEIALWIKEKGFGYVFSAKDEKGIISFLSDIQPSKKDELRAKGELARKVAEEEYSKEKILEKFKQVI